MPYEVLLPAVAGVEGKRVLVKINKKWLETTISKYMGKQYVEYMLNLMGCSQSKQNPELLVCELAKVQENGDVEINPITYIFALRYLKEIAEHFKFKF